MTPSEMLRGVADALDKDDLAVVMAHNKRNADAFQFAGEDTQFLGETRANEQGQGGGILHYAVPCHRILTHMAKWLKKVELDAANVHAEQLAEKRKAADAIEREERRKAFGDEH